MLFDARSLINQLTRKYVNLSIFNHHLEARVHNIKVQLNVILKKHVSHLPTLANISSTSNSNISQQTCTTIPTYLQR